MVQSLVMVMGFIHGLGFGHCFRVHARSCGIYVDDIVLAYIIACVVMVGLGILCMKKSESIIHYKYYYHCVTKSVFF